VFDVAAWILYSCIPQNEISLGWPQASNPIYPQQKPNLYGAASKSCPSPLHVLAAQRCYRRALAVVVLLVR
jgi:hypothetical protein